MRSSKEGRIEELKRVKQQLELNLSEVQKELSKLSLDLEEKKSPSKPFPPTKLFPINTRVKITNKRDPGGLYQRIGKVTGHTKRQVRVTIDSKEYRRAPTSLTLV